MKKLISTLFLIAVVFSGSVSAQTTTTTAFEFDISDYFKSMLSYFGIMALTDSSPPPKLKSRRLILTFPTTPTP